MPRNSFTCVGRLWRSRHNTIDAILIQWHVNKLRGILKLLPKVCNFNWCWHRTLPLKKKRFSIFENLLKTSGTTTKVLSCSKIPLTSMRFIASCENVVPRFQTSPILSFPPPLPDWSLHPLWRNSSTASAEEFYYSFYYNEGLENKLTRAPLLGLAKSICYSKYVTQEHAFSCWTYSLLKKQHIRVIWML